MPDTQEIEDFIDEVVEYIDDWCTEKMREWGISGDIDTIADFSNNLQRRINNELNVRLEN